MIVSIDGERVDITHRQAIVLQNIHEIGGEANTRDITRRSGLKDWEVRESAKQAEDRGLVEYIGSDSASYGPGSDPNLYELTGTGRRVVQRGIPGKVITLNQTDAKLPEQELEELRKWVSRVENRVDATNESELSKRFEELRSRLDESDAGDVDEIRAEIDELEEYVTEWNRAAGRVIRAIRRALEDRGVDLAEYIDEVKAEEATN